MKIKKVLELSIDVDGMFNELPHILRALLDTMPTLESQVAFLQAIRQDVDTLLKGAEADGQQVRDISRK